MARILAAAQYAALDGDIDGNIARHLQVAKAASGLGVHLLVFPELSLTGYELALASSLTLDAHDPRLAPLKAAAQRSAMTIVAGAPVRFGPSHLHIGSLAFLPDGAVAVYTKRYLHQGEEAVFTPGQGGPILQLGRISLAMAICADTANPSHSANAAAHKANVYAASMLLSETSYTEESARLRGYAGKHSVVVLMANHAFKTGGLVPVGRSAIWDEQGKLIAAAPSAEVALILARRRSKAWEGAVFPLTQSIFGHANETKEASMNGDLLSSPTAPFINDQGHLFGEL